VVALARSGERVSRGRGAFTLLSLLALALGFAAGLVAHGGSLPALQTLASAVAPIGTTWTRLLQLVVMPLVVTNLILGVAGGADARAVGRMGARALGLFAATLVAGAAFGWLVVPPVLRMLPAGALRMTAGAAGGALPPAAAPASFADWIAGLGLLHPLEAAGRGNILPFVLLAAAFGLALTRVPIERRRPLLETLAGISEAVLVLLRWILAVMPIAVFCLVFPMAARSGAESAGAVGAFVVLSSLMLALWTLGFYPLAVLGGRVSLARFARAMAPVQTMAAGTRSSLACLPALMRCAEETLELPKPVTSFVLPLAVATYKAERMPTSVVRLLFLAAAYGVALDPGKVALFIGISIVVSFSSPGIPSAGAMTTIPLYASLGIPVEGIVILNAVDAIPDIFKTVLNVTADMAVTTVVARGEAGAVGRAAVSDGA
jgi:Na+/H+-dicarboxylate symporter